MRILVTGSAGFLGSHVILRLLARGDTVVGIDTAERVTGPADYQHAHVDITGPAFHEYAAGPFDAVIHLAAIASPREAQANPTRAFDVNIRGTYEVCKLAVRHDAKLIFASSAHVYGIPPAFVPTEEDARLKPQDVYTATKIAAEELCRQFADGYGLKYIGLRLYNGYGPGQPRGYFIPDTIDQARRHGEIRVRSPGTTKDWIHIDDMAEAVVQACASRYTGELNVGSGQDTSLLNVARVIGILLNVPVSAMPEDDPAPSYMRAGITLARRALAWTPTIPLEYGLHRLILETSRG